MQFILVFESNSQSMTDYKYVKAFLDAKFIVKHKITPIFAGSKTKLLSNTVIKKIENKCRDFDKNTVIVFADVDSTSNPNVVKLNNAIKKTCQTYGYELVWFNRDIEEVFLGKQVPNSEKKAAVSKFL